MVLKDRKVVDSVVQRKKYYRFPLSSVFSVANRSEGTWSYV